MKSSDSSPSRGAQNAIAGGGEALAARLRQLGRMGRELRADLGHRRRAGLHSSPSAKS